jgi:hypothetical protein
MSPDDLGLTRAAYLCKNAAAKLDVGLTLLDQLIAEGRLKTVKLGEGRRAKRLVLAASMAELFTGGAEARA